MMFTTRKCLLVAALVYILLFSYFTSGKDDDYEPGLGTGKDPGDPSKGKSSKGDSDKDDSDKDDSDKGGSSKDDSDESEGEKDPAQIFARALECFNDKYLYCSCAETHRLTVEGEMHVPPEEVDAFCSGPCREETHLVLKCIDEIMLNFKFYNKATTRDIRDTIHAGCANGDHKGDFNVEEHIKHKKDSSDGFSKTASLFLPSLVMIIMGPFLLL